MRDDAELVIAARSGDHDALGEVYDRYADRIHDFCFSVLRNRDDAADAMQDTFVLAASRLGQLRDPAKLKPWLYAIARNEALRRARARRRAVPTEGAGVDIAAEPVDLEAGDAADNAARLVWAAAAGLSARDRSLLDLNVRQGLDGQELADAIGVTPGHAYVLVHRLRDQVERSLGALLVAGPGRDDCTELQQLLVNWDGRFSPLWRKRVARHVESCDVCERSRKALVSPLAALAAVPLVGAPALLRAPTLERMHAARDRNLGSVPDRRRRWIAAAAAILAALAIGGAVTALATSDDDARLGIVATHSDHETTGDTTTTTPGIAPAVAPDETTIPAVAPGAPAATPPSGNDGTGPTPAPTEPDTQGPSITNISSKQACIVVNGAPSDTSVSATVSDPSGVAKVVVEWNHDVDGGGSEVMTISGSSYGVVLGPFADPGVLTWSVRATDSAGNTTTAPRGAVVVKAGPCP
ncbi:MAG: RNA polymerase sigma factor [Acidimicrobiia bacterium]